MSHVVSLSKGANVNLSKLAPAMQKIMVGLGWTKRQTDGAPFDLDASLFMLNEAGEVEGAHGFIYYRNKESQCGAVKHNGDSITGDKETKKDVETIDVILAKIPESIKKLVIAVSINEAQERAQNFGMVSDAFIRVINADNQEELTRYDLSEDASTETAIVLGELYRNGDDWKFKAIGQGYQKGLAQMIEQFGLSAG